MGQTSARLSSPTESHPTARPPPEATITLLQLLGIAFSNAVRKGLFLSPIFACPNWNLFELEPIRIEPKLNPSERRYFKDPINFIDTEGYNSKAKTLS